MIGGRCDLSWRKSSSLTCLLVFASAGDGVLTAFTSKLHRPRTVLQGEREAQPREREWPHGESR